MLRNCLAAALRHGNRNRAFTALGVAGLAIGMSTALLAALVLRHEYGFDHHIAGIERIYTPLSVVTPPGRATITMPNSNSFVGGLMKLRFPEIESLTRLGLATGTFVQGTVTLREDFYWADANAFDVLPMPGIAGDVRTALQRPDALVLSRDAARRYFGEDAPLDRTLLLDGHAMRVAAVIENPPAHGTHLRSGIFAPAIASWSWLRVADENPANVAGSPIGFGTNTYLKLRKGATAEPIRARMPTLAGEFFSRPPQGWTASLELVRLDRLNTDPRLNPAFRTRVVAASILGAVVLLIACVNIVNLVTARAALRGPEVVARRMAGAGVLTLMLQFLAESLLHVSIAGVIAIALVEWLPHANAFLDTGLAFDYWRDPTLMAGMLATVALLALLIGSWPALVLARRPLVTLSRPRPATHRGDLVRRALVTLQFALLIGLLIATGIVYRQHDFALRDALRVDTDEVLILRAPCQAALLEEMRRLRGVRQLGCASAASLGEMPFLTARDLTGTEQLLFFVPLQGDVLRLYGVQPIAGTLTPTAESRAPAFAINETAARRLGFARPADAVGFRLPAPIRGASPLPVAAVVPDFSLGSVQRKIEAVAYLTMTEHPEFQLVTVKLSGRAIPETLAAIDAVWQRVGNGKPLDRFFVSDHLQRLYLSMLREAQGFGGVALVAVLLGGLGLLGLSASIAERRTREIGVRKALGAGTPQILRMLLMEFARPVLWANVLAWPVSAILMLRWLEGYAYHIELPLWLFPAAGFVALAIAMLAVATHAAVVARARPVTALRYE